MRYGHNSAEVGYYGYLDLFIHISRMMPIGGSKMSAEIGRGRRKPSRRRSSSGAWKRKKNARRTRSGAKKKKLSADKMRPSERKKGGGGKKEGGKRRLGRKRRRPGNGWKTSDDRSRQSDASNKMSCKGQRRWHAKKMKLNATSLGSRSNPPIG
jgi:hypothetical protein